MKDEEWDELDEKAVFTIHLCLADEVIFNAEALKLDEVTYALFSEELRRKASFENSKNALVTENKGRSHNREQKGCSKSRGKSKSQSKVKCYHCASYHYTPRREFFTAYKAGDLGSVKMGNQSVVKIVGIGDIIVQISVGCTMTLKDVSHIWELRFNLMSSTVLDGEGYSQPLVPLSCTCRRNKGHNWTTNPRRAFLSGMEMRSMATDYGIRRKEKSSKVGIRKVVRSRHVVFHEQETLEEEKPIQASNGVRDVASIPIPQEDATGETNPHEVKLKDDEKPATIMDGRVEPNNEGV
ncbi:hypothetical protein CRG98_046406 [Punica granatum]|uniref:Retrovirus-related Pol polyprotein from transposon TNT 1-94-like beta-barrel domain-containing protein n=1 Tax=Punica granatum TaxID=22663 RepID=A0A2I0HNA6_PUNGR|nr:hypothetical protein CRG98_046406 [Punica granatum]